MAVAALLVVAVLALGAGAYAVVSFLTNRGPIASAARGATVSSSAGPSAGAKPHPARGRITAINGQVWTVTPAKGSPLTVQVSSKTKFGSRKAPLSLSAFAVGTRVAVAGPRVGDRVEATRILIAKPKAAPSPAG